MTTWLHSTDFARYALIPEEILPAWEGTEADEVIDAYVSALRPAGHDILTLGAEPLSVTWIAESLTFARWCHADDDTGLIPAVHAAATADGWKDVLSLTLGGRYVLADAAYEADRILASLRDAHRPAEALRVELPPGRYRVQSLTIDPDPNTRFMLDRLLPE
ncbi:Imm21 family immunity protein [Streptomyces zaomyceticus]|uniref:Imm21 family immunity protein n=1 Tax=Streptomyces zaomyceticus TaxID=68286 RepID=UPI0016785A3C|nr:Imm21 family immunity protein [Streptomyces zaomyceticus]